MESLVEQKSQLGGQLLGGGGTGIWQYENFISKEECEELIKFFWVVTTGIRIIK